MATRRTPDPRLTVRIGWNNHSQTVTLPLDFRFPDSVCEVFIRRKGESVILSPRPNDWVSFFEPGQKASAGFMVDAELLPIQEHSF